MLVNNATETSWFQMLLERFPVCLPARRIAFWRHDHANVGARQGQAFLPGTGTSARFGGGLQPVGPILRRIGVMYKFAAQLAQGENPRRRLTFFRGMGAQISQVGGTTSAAVSTGVVRSGGRTDLDGGVQGRQSWRAHGNARFIETISMD